jgi:hypothetical protein
LRSARPARIADDEPLDDAAVSAGVGDQADAAGRVTAHVPQRVGLAPRAEQGAVRAGAEIELDDGVVLRGHRRVTEAPSVVRTTRVAAA